MTPKLRSRRQARKTKGLDRRPYTSRKQMTDAKGK